MLRLALGILVAVALTPPVHAESIKATAGEKHIVLVDAQFGGRRSVEYFKTLEDYVVFDETLDLVALLGDPVPGEKKPLMIIYRCEEGGSMKIFRATEGDAPEKDGRAMTKVTVDCR